MDSEALNQWAVGFAVQLTVMSISASEARHIEAPASMAELAEYISDYAHSVTDAAELLSDAVLYADADLHDEGVAKLLEAEVHLERYTSALGTFCE